MKKVFILLVFGFVQAMIGLDTGEKLFVHTMGVYVPLSARVSTILYNLAEPYVVEDVMNNDNSLPLFTCFPGLKKKIVYISLGTFPTPIQRMQSLESILGCNTTLYVKRDDLAGALYNNKYAFGGNKIRKLEFLLADAKANGAKTILTYGCIGSNHVVATASACQQLGLRCMALLIPQPVTDTVKRNMFLMHEYNVEMILSPDRLIRDAQTISIFVQNKYNYGDMPYFIPTGGSCPVGVIGFVNAVFELKNQIEQGLLPEPDYIYVAAGSVGTCSGLMLGCKAANLKTKIVPIAIEPDDNHNPLYKKIISLFKEANALLHNADDQFPLFDIDESEAYPVLDFAGPDYGESIKEGDEATFLFDQSEKIVLDPTYTAKTGAALLEHIRSKQLQGKIVLYWHTFCGHVHSKNGDYKKLPVAFHHFF